jgi:transposase
MRFVPLKSAEQLAIQAIRRIRSRLFANRVRVVNQSHGPLGERGVIIVQATGKLRRGLPRIVDDESNDLNSIVRELIGELREN